VPLITGGLLMTVMENAGSEAVACPSETRMTMLEKVPVFCGMPLICPVVPLMLAHEGSPVAVKLNESPSGSLAVGVKL
jgi:hypothetical protein